MNAPDNKTDKTDISRACVSPVNKTDKTDIPSSITFFKCFSSFPKE